MSTVELEAAMCEAVLNVIYRISLERGYSCYKAIMAQAMSESGWCRSTLSNKYYNFFGMKCGTSWKGKSVNLKTKEEYTPGVLTTITDNFRVYESIEHGINGYFNFIESYSRYSNLREAKSDEEYIQLLKKDGWATSEKYVETLTAILHGNTLKTMLAALNITAAEITKEKIISDAERAIAKEVIAGKYGNGSVRKENLYAAVQAAVNDILRG